MSGLVSVDEYNREQTPYILDGVFVYNRYCFIMVKTN